MSSSRSVVDCSLLEVLQIASSLINSAVVILVFLYNVIGTVSKLTILIGVLWFLGAANVLATQIDSFLNIVPSSSHVPSSSEWIWAITYISLLGGLVWFSVTVTFAHCTSLFDGCRIRGTVLSVICILPPARSRIHLLASKKSNPSMASDVICSATMKSCCSVTSPIAMGADTFLYTLTGTPSMSTSL